MPYADSALAPVISANTLGFRSGKHHKTYVDNLKKRVSGTPFEHATLEAIIEATAGQAERAGPFNNAPEVWNYTFYRHGPNALPIEPREAPKGNSGTESIREPIS